MLLDRRAVPQGWNVVATVKNGSLHLHIRIERHIPRILVDDKILEALTLGENVVAELNPFAHGNNIQVIGEEV